MIIRYRTLVPVFGPELENVTAPVVYVIDAGHGGEDGGAVSASGVTESTLNLEIAQHLNDMLSFLGKDTVMTRPGENAVYSVGASTLREKKRSDLQNRVAMVNGYDDAVLLSIHQNSLPTVPSVHGAQTFYNTVSGADQLAEQIQQSLNQTVNIGNEKAKKQIDDTIYLMRRVSRPAVLVECGFLSNAEETKLLQEQKYQTRGWLWRSPPGCCRNLQKMLARMRSRIRQKTSKRMERLSHESKNFFLLYRMRK